MKLKISCAALALLAILSASPALYANSTDAFPLADPDTDTRAVPGWGDYFSQLEDRIPDGNLRNSGENKLTLLVDGKETIQSVVKDVRSAKKFICIMVYEWMPDEIGKEFVSLLGGKVKQGVKVRVVLDGYGSVSQRRDEENVLIKLMKHNGIDVVVRKEQFMHFDHRKVIVMDNGQGSVIAYTGGMNIGHTMDFHDQQTRIVGPAATFIYNAFRNDWAEVTNRVSRAAPVQGAQTYVIDHVGGNADHYIKDAYLLAIKTATKIIRIEDPFFTDRDVINALIKAARRKVQVQLIIPAKDTQPTTLGSFRSHYPAMLKAGVEVYEYQPRMEHLKAATMDHIWTTVGSSNLDTISLERNNELNLLVMDHNFAKQVDERIFDKDIGQSKRITNYRPNPMDTLDSALPL